MSFLIDSDILINGIRGREPASSFISMNIEAGLYISVITYGEVLEGLFRASGASEGQRTMFVAFIELFDLLEATDQEARAYAEVRTELRSQGNLIPENDLWIAATALVRNLQLVSNDQHFARIPELSVYSP